MLARPSVQVVLVSVHVFQWKSSALSKLISPNFVGAKGVRVKVCVRCTISKTETRKFLKT